MEKSYNTLEEIINEMYSEKPKAKKKSSHKVSNEGGCGTHKEGANPADHDKFESTCPKCGHKQVLNASNCDK